MTPNAEEAISSSPSPIANCLSLVLYLFPLSHNSNSVQVFVNSVQAISPLSIHNSHACRETGIDLCGRRAVSRTGVIKRHQAD
jgi:hypothetical protein